MNRQEDNLKKAFEKITPDVWDAIEKEIIRSEVDDSIMVAVFTFGEASGVHRI